MLQKIVERERKRIDWFRFRNIIKNPVLFQRTAGFFYLQLNWCGLVLQHIATAMVTENDRWFIKNTGIKRGIGYESMLQDYPERKS